jgi:hypothetical protein
MTMVATFLPFLYIFLTGWKFDERWSAAAGLVVTVVANGLAFIPSAETASTVLFEVKLLSGCALTVVTARLAFRRKHRRYPDRLQ